MELTVFYDAQCKLCRQARDWLAGQRTHVPVRLVAAQSKEGQERRRSVPWVGDQLVVVADDGRVWYGHSAYVVCLWATRRWRRWARRVSRPGARPVARRFTHFVSAHRDEIGAILARRDHCDECGSDHEGDPWQPSPATPPTPGSASSTPPSRP